tara:strand:+ start:992 stop:1261 length:270 start_codon:yes stop_codon:yes gene_type:complete
MKYWKKHPRTPRLYTVTKIKKGYGCNPNTITLTSDKYTENFHSPGFSDIKNAKVGDTYLLCLKDYNHFSRWEAKKVNILNKFDVLNIKE